MSWKMAAKKVTVEVIKHTEVEIPKINILILALKIQIDLKIFFFWQCENQKCMRHFLGFSNTLYLRMRIFPAQDNCNFLCGISQFLSFSQEGGKQKTSRPSKWLVHIWWFFFSLPQLTNRVVNQNKHKGTKGVWMDHLFCNSHSTINFHTLF